MPRQNDFELALRHHQAGRTSEAERLFEAILRKHPRHPDALQYLGVAAFRKGQHKVASRLLRQVCEVRPDDGEIHYNLGVVLRAMGKTEEAVAAYRRTLALLPDHAEALNNLGNALKDLGEWEEALTVYRRALDNAPRHPLASHNLGVALLALGRPIEALAAYKRAVEINPGLAEAHDGLGTCLLAMGQPGDAVPALRRAIGIRPDFAAAHGRLGMAFFKTGQKDEAEAALRRALDLKPSDAEACNVLGQVLSGKGQKETALSYLKKATEAAPDELRYRHNYGVVVSRVVPPWHFSMLNDAARNVAYERAIARVVKPGMHVLEIGTGSGLLAMLAARAGAKRVTTCERVSVIAEKAREIVARNGLGERIDVLERDSTDLVVGHDIGERADLLVSEILSNSVVGEGVLRSVGHARRTLLKPGAPIMPRSASIMACLVGGRDLADAVSVGTVAGFDLSAFNAFAPHQHSLEMKPYDFEYLSDDQELFTFDFASDIELSQSRELDVAATGTGTCLGMLQWIRLFLDEETIFENHPRQQEAHNISHWNLTLFPFASPLTVGAGDRVRITVRYAVDGLFIDAKGVVGQQTDAAPAAGENRA